MVAWRKAMAGTVVGEPRYGQALPTWQEAETNHPKLRSSHSGLLIPLPTPHGSKQSLPIQGYG